jgi:hypothetical protein
VICKYVLSRSVKGEKRYKGEGEEEYEMDVRDRAADTVQHIVEIG